MGNTDGVGGLQALPKQGRPNLLHSRISWCGLKSYGLGLTPVNLIRTDDQMVGSLGTGVCTQAEGRAVPEASWEGEGASPVVLFG